MKTRPTLAALMEAQQHQETKLASLTSDVSNVKDQISGMTSRLDKFEDENRKGFERVYDKLDRLAARPLPWNYILTFGGILTSLGIAAFGGMLTVILALAAWGNAYFSNKIESVQKESVLRLDALERRLDNRRDEKGLP